MGNVPKESHHAGHLKRMSPRSLFSILAILPISTVTSWHLDQRFSPLQNFLKIFFWASLHSPLYACLPTKATSTVNVGNTVDAVNADKPINVSTLKQQLFEEPLPSLLARGLKRRKQGVDDQQKVQEEVLNRLACIKTDLKTAIATRYPRATMLQRKQLLAILAAKVRAKITAKLRDNGLTDWDEVLARML